MSVTLTDRVQALAGESQPTALGAVGLGATAVALGVTAGPLGLVAGLVIAGLGVVVSPIAVFGLGQAVVLVLLPSPTPLQLALLEGALFIALVAPATRTRPTRLVTLSALLFAVSGTLVWYGSQVVGLQVTGLALLLAVGLLMYGIHRYERVVLGLAGGDAA